MVSFKSQYRKNRSREIELKFKSNRIYKKGIIICIMIALLVLTHCSTIPEETAPPPEPVIEQSKVAPPELSEKEKEEIDAKIEKLKTTPIKNLIENIRATKGYENKQSWEALEEVLNRKLLIILKKEFPNSKDVLELPIYDATGVESYFNLKLKDLFMLYVSQNPDNGATITKENLSLIRNKKEQSVTVFINPPGARQSQEATFKVFNGKLVLSTYRAGMQINPVGYEYVAYEIFSMLSLKENEYLPKLNNINQKLVDSIK